MRRDTRLDRMFETNQQWQDRTASQGKLNFERKVTRKLLDAGGITRLNRKVMESQWDGQANEGHYLTFGWFMDECPNFPFILRAAEEEWSARVIEVFTASSRSCKLWNMWSELKQDMPKSVREGKQIALMIPCSQESGLSPALVMHNGALPDGPFEHPVPNRIHVRLTEPRTGEYVFLKQLKYFSAQVELIWQAQ